jgi:hypothetical protein
MQFADRAFCLARASAGSNSAARMEIMAMTTSNSIRVKAGLPHLAVDLLFGIDAVSLLLVYLEAF